MSRAAPFSWSEFSAKENAEAGFRSIFARAPIAAARCNRQGEIVEVNRAFDQALDPHLAKQRVLRLSDLVAAEDRDSTETLLRALLDSTCESIRIAGKERGSATDGLAVTHWTAWRLPASGGELPHALLIAERDHERAPTNESVLQTQRWEAVGRLAGGVVHDFNNLLTGVMLYCDLLLSSLDTRDCRRRYASEIRVAVLQAARLVRQLLVFARPQATQVRSLCLNEIADGMRDLLTRLIGENIKLEFRLDPELGLVEIDEAQAQQIILNLVLNARDALPNGGRIDIETSNCRFQTVAGSAPTRQTAFPCVSLLVADNGTGMDAKTRQHLFEPFFTTKGASRGTGLGLTTVRSIVTTNRGLIHIESEPGQGTRAMILLPQTSQSTETEFQSTPPCPTPSPTPLHEVKKESLI